VSTLQSALSANALGFSVFPLTPKSKVPLPGSSGFKAASTSIEDVKKWWSKTPDANVGIACGESGLTVLDFDSESAIPEWLRNVRTLKVKSKQGVHFYFYGERASAKLFVGGKPVGDLKSLGGYVLGQGSVHPEGPIYTTIDDSPIITTPARIEELLKSTTKVPVDASISGPKIPRGQHDTELHSIAGKLRSIKMEEEAIYNALVEICEKRCENYGTDYLEMCRKHAHNICKHAVPTEIIFTIGGKLPEETVAASAAASATRSAAASAEVQPEPLGFDMTEEEVEAEYEKDYPRIPLKEVGGRPEFRDDMLYGPAGDLVRVISEYSEAHPMGMYLNLLVTLGSIFGRGPHFITGDTKHFTNEYLLNVGDSSTSRKGTGRNSINKIAKLLDEKWFKNCTSSGFGSSQGIIHKIRDSSIYEKIDKKTGETVVVEVKGVKDKRLLIAESEAANLFKLASQPEGRTSILLRDGWDGNRLENNVKGKTTEGESMSVSCAEPHLSFCADTNIQELIATLPPGSDSNGFGNRFLYCFVYRTKLVPNGGPEIDYAPYVIRLFEAITFARTIRKVPFSVMAAKNWGRFYSTLEQERLPGRAGKMCDRAVAHIRRIAMILALVDLSPVIELKHLKAARLIWDYCEESALLIFNGTTKDQDRIAKEQDQIVNFVQANGPTTLTKIREDLFKRNQKAEWVRTQVDALVASKRLCRNGDNVAAVTI
jgi:hypothetical protein